jgi:hypothetical protein
MRSRFSSRLLFHNSFSTSAASNARRMPSTAPAFASSFNGTEAQRKVLPSIEAFDERDNMPPGMLFSGARTLLLPVPTKRTPSNWNALR